MSAEDKVNEVIAVLDNNIDTGDIILHGPTKERWTVAFVRGKYLSWVGWPEGTVVLVDCQLVKKASKEYKEALIQQMAKDNSHDHRCRYAREVLNNRSK